MQSARSILPYLLLWLAINAFVVLVIGSLHDSALLLAISTSTLVGSVYWTRRGCSLFGGK